MATFSISLNLFLNIGQKGNYLHFLESGHFMKHEPAFKENMKKGEGEF